MIRKLIYIYFIISVFSSCDFLENESPEVSFLELSKPTLSTTSFQGASTHNITHAWVIIDGQLLGVFPVPGKVPIIPSGKSMSIEIRAGVSQDGDPNSSVEYPFYNPVFVNNINLASNETLPVQLNYTYRSDIVFDFIEDFELNSHILTYDLDNNTNSRVTLTNEDKASGQKSGLVTLNIENRDAEFGCFPSFDNKNNKKGNVFVEFDYKAYAVVLVGTELDGNTTVSQSYVVRLAPSKTWKRVYVNLTKEISSLSVKNYRVIFGTTIDESGLSKADFYFDNVKLVHF